MPFFWSDQARHRIQFLGRSATDDDGDVVEVVVGRPDEHRFLALYGRRGRLWGALGVNVPRLVMPYAKLLDERARAGTMRWSLLPSNEPPNKPESTLVSSRCDGSIPFDP